MPASRFVVDGDFTSALLLASAALASVGIHMKRRWPAVAASAAAPDDRYVHDCSFVSSGVLVSLLPDDTSSCVCGHQREDAYACSSCIGSRVR